MERIVPSSLRFLAFSRKLALRQGFSSAASALRRPFRVIARTAETLRASAKAPMAQCGDVCATNRPATRGASAASPVAICSSALLTRPRISAGVFRNIAANSAALVTGERTNGMAIGAAMSGDGARTAATPKSGSSGGEYDDELCQREATLESWCHEGTEESADHDRGLGQANDAG